MSLRAAHLAAIKTLVPRKDQPTVDKLFRDLVFRDEITAYANQQGTLDHGSMSGLSDDDHTQYLKEKASSGAASEIPIHTHASTDQAGTIDHGALTGRSDDDHTQYLLANGTRALSANWDAGAFEIRAQTLESDVATGTAPLTVASTTVVTNLNADTVDGKDETAFVLVDGTRALTGDWDVGEYDLTCKDAVSDTLTVGTGSDTLSVDSAGHLVLAGDATVWDDLRVPMTAVKTGGSKDPGFSVFKTNGSGSQGVFTWWFDKAAEEELFFAVQIPHAWKLESTIYPHVHWAPKTDGASGAVVNWGLEYTIAELGGVFGNTTIIYGSTQVPADAVLAAGKHYLTNIGAGISMAGVDTLSAMIICRVFRDATGALATDDYDDDAGLLEIDFHYEMDSLGSNEELAK